MFSATSTARARGPFTGQVRSSLPTPMEDEDSSVTSTRTPACVSGGRASGGAGRRPFPRAPAHGALHSNKALLATTAAVDAGATKPARKAQRGRPLVQWVWPANSGSAIARAGSEWFRGATGGAGREVAQENPMRLQGRTQKSSVVVGTVCEPVRPTRLVLSAAEGYPTSSRVIYTAKGGHTNPADAHPSSTTTGYKASKMTSSTTRPPALKLPLPHLHEAPWLDSAGLGFDGGGGGLEGGGGTGGGGGGGTRSRAYSANSAGAAGLQSPRYLQSTTVSQAKAVEPSGRKQRTEKRSSSSRLSGGAEARRGRGRASLGGGDSDVGFGGSGEGSGAGGVGFGGPGGMLESLGGFLGIGKGAGAGGGGGGAAAGAGGKDAARWGKSRRQTRNTASRGSTGSGKMGSKVFKRLRKSTEGKHSRYGSVKVKAPSGAAGRAAQADELAHQHPRVMRRDEREILTMHAHGVLRPEGVKLRVVKASGRTLEDTKFHMEIRTQRPGQVWSVCRRHQDFRNLHSCLQGRFPALVLPRLPRPPTGGGIVLEPATLERARAGLQAYIAAVVASVPAAWGVEEFVMFLDSDEKGRRLFSRKRKKETRRVVALPSPAAERDHEDEDEGEAREEAPQRAQQKQQKEHRPAATRTAAFPSDLVSPRVGATATGDGFHKKSLLDLKVEEKKMALEALEGAAANHFDGVGAVMNTAVSFSDDNDDDSEEFEEGGDFIDGEDAIRAMLDRDADEAEDDNLFSIPAGTDFGIPLDDDDDDDDIGDGFDLTYHG